MTVQIGIAKMSDNKKSHNTKFFWSGMPLIWLQKRDFLVFLQTQTHTHKKQNERNRGCETSMQTLELGCRQIKSVDLNGTMDPNCGDKINRHGLNIMRRLQRGRNEHKQPIIRMIAEIICVETVGAQKVRGGNLAHIPPGTEAGKGS